MFPLDEESFHNDGYQNYLNISIMPHRPYKPALEPGGHLGLYSHQPLKLFVVGPKAVVENSCRYRFDQFHVCLK